ncbi:hypothetical protein ACEQ8H_006195 [Pleosporales sp. CAS-2024a]
MTSNRLIIGLDYGTTFTGVSFCETSSTNAGPLGPHIEVIHDWPSCSKVITKEKVPSEVAYLAGGLRWGANIPHEAKRHMWTKLELDPQNHDDLTKIKRELFSYSPASHREPVDIIADFLMQVKTHLFKNLDNRYGQDLWKTLPITLVVTVPAVWSDRAKDLTLQAVMRAGLDSLQFPQLDRTIVATEPESAAVYTIKSLNGSAREQQFKNGEGVVVIDMGGGTVDTISYKIISLTPIAVKEATVGGGAQCGGTFVDRRFLQWLERRLGTEDFKSFAGCRSEEIPRVALSNKAAKILQDFTMGIKCNYRGDDQSFYIRLPGRLGTIIEDKDRGIYDGEIEMTSDDLREMFDFSVAQTYKLLTAQKLQAENNGVQIKYVFLVGGFSESPYMYDTIKKFAKDLRLQAFRPASAWSAVVRGAAMAGLEGGNDHLVKNRKCRRNYGVSCNEDFKPTKHSESESYICPYDGRKMALGQMDWLLKKSEALTTSKRAHARSEHEYKFWLRTNKTTTVTLFASDNDIAPRLESDSSVKKVATLEVDLNDVPQKHMKRKISSGRPYDIIRFTMEIAVQSSLEFSVLVKGKKYSSLTTTYH